MTDTAHNLNPPAAAARLERSSSDRMFAGVAGGLARYFDIHPAVYRVGFVVLALLGGAGFVIYVAAALVIPNEGEEESFASRILKERRNRPWPLIGLGLLTVGMASLLSHTTLWPHGDVWPGLLILGAAILYFTRHTVAPEPQVGPTSGPDSTTAVAQPRHRNPVATFFKAIAIAFATILALLAIAVAIFGATFHVGIGHGVGERHVIVATASSLEPSYRLGVGTMVLDLRNVSFDDGTKTLDARVDVGNLRVIVPHDAVVQLNATAQTGQVEALGAVDDGRHASVAYSPARRAGLILNAHVGAGRVQIVREAAR
jgi:phage shock protein PspC (stress-responsive transcriptional regulator)